MTLLAPYWLFCLPFLLFLMWKYRHVPLQDAWHRVIRPSMLKRLRSSTKITGSLLPLFLLACGIVLCLSNPASKKSQPEEAFAVPETWWALVDLSESMNQEDISPNRLTAAQQVLDRISLSAGARPLGMIVFAGDAFIAHPPTHDRLSFADFTQVLSTDLISLEGSRPDKALSLVQTIGSDHFSYKARLWLLTDGGGIDRSTVSVAREMVERDYRLDVILTANPVSRYPVPIDSRAAAQLAEIGKGELWTMNALGQLSANPFDSSQLASEKRSYSLILGSYTHWSQWLILPLLPLCLWLMMREQRT